MSAVSITIPRAHAQGVAPYRIIVPYTPGNAVDQMARILAEKISGPLGAPVVVDNKPGATGALALSALKSLPADGRSMIMATYTVINLVPMTKSRPTHSPAEFMPVAHIADSSIALSAPIDASYKNLKEFVSWLKQNPQKASFGNESPGSPAHLVGLEFGRMVGVPMTFIGYKSTAQLISDELGNQIPSAITALPSVYPLHVEKRLQILGVASEIRPANAQDIPTFKEQGFDLSVTSMYGIWYLAGTPPAMVDRMSQTVVDAVKLPDVQKKLREMGVDPTGYPQAQFSSLIEASDRTWKKIVADTKFRTDD